MTLLTRKGSSRRVSALAMVALVGGVCALSACGSSNSSTGGSTPGGGASSASADPALLGPDKPASGTPVKIGFLYDGQSAAIDTTHQVLAARAVVKYANAKLGGVGGHPIQLVECESHSSPTTDCGDQLVAAKVIAAVGGQFGEVPQVEKALSRAGIPYIDNNNQNGQFSLSNFLLAVGAPLQYAADNGIKKVTIVVIDVTTSVAGIKQFAGILAKNVGVEVNVVGIPEGTADATPQIEAAEGASPGLLHLVGNDTFCASALKAIRTLGLTVKVTGINRCLSKSASGSVPGGFAGVTIFSSISRDPAQAQTKLYDAFLAKYLPGVADDADYQTGYQALLGVIRGVNAGGITAFTSAGVTTALQKMPATPLPLGGGLTYSCNGKALAGFGSICSAGTILATATADGDQQDFHMQKNSTNLYALG